MDPEFKEPFANPDQPGVPSPVKVSYEQPMFPTVVMSPGLIDKLAILVWYLDETQNKRRGLDASAVASILDHAEVQDFLHRMKQLGRVANTTFLGAKP